MNDANARVRDHYQAAVADGPAVLAKIAAVLGEMDGPVTAERLAGFDQFHAGGLAATAELARRTGVKQEWRVLDAGSGLGGPSRYLAETFGCEVTGVDLAPVYVGIAKLLAERAGLAGRVSYHDGSIAALPFPDAAFDLVWTQHVAMNIADRDGLYAELRRVLKPAGLLAFYDPYAPDHAQPPHYPTPWAETADASTLLSQAATMAALHRAGFAVTLWEDVTEQAKGWLARQQQQAAQAPADGPKLSPALVVGARMQGMVANFVRNLAEGRVGLVMGVCTAI